MTWTFHSSSADTATNLIFTQGILLPWYLYAQPRHLPFQPCTTARKKKKKKEKAAPQQSGRSIVLQVQSYYRQQSHKAIVSIRYQILQHKIIQPEYQRLSTPHITKNSLTAPHPALKRSDRANSPIHNLRIRPSTIPQLLIVPVNSDSRHVSEPYTRVLGNLILSIDVDLVELGREAFRLFLEKLSNGFARCDAVWGEENGNGRDSAGGDLGL